MAQYSQDDAENEDVAPYAWAALVNDKQVAQEYNEHADEQTTFAELNFSLRMRGDLGHEVPTFVNDNSETFTFIAEAQRGTHQDYREDIQPGDALVWGHKRVHQLYNINGQTVNTFAESMIFGRESKDGATSIKLILPSGQIQELTSFDEASRI